MSGEWSGGAANRMWQRKGWRGPRPEGDAERGQRLYAQLADIPFFCEDCGAMHPLREHSRCRAAEHEPCEFAAGSLHCVRPGCRNPHHQGPQLGLSRTEAA
jgi:hypothetical protein